MDRAEVHEENQINCPGEDNEKARILSKSVGKIHDADTEQEKEGINQETKPVIFSCCSSRVIKWI